MGRCNAGRNIAIQCNSDDINCQLTNHDDQILIGHLSLSSSSALLSSCFSTKAVVTSSIPPLAGYRDCGIQIDLTESNIDLLNEIYSNRLPLETIQQFYEVCHSDIQWTRTQIDEYLQHHNTEQKSIPTLRQLCLNVLNQWNERIKSANPLIDTRSIDDLLQDINDEAIFDDLTLDNNHTTVDFINTNQLQIPSSVINSLEELYGELPNRSLLSIKDDGILIPLDDELSLSIYQTLQRFSSKINQTVEPVIDDQRRQSSKKKKNHTQQWKLTPQNQSNYDVNKSHIPSLRQIMDEEQQATKSQRSKQVFNSMMIMSF